MPTSHSEQINEIVRLIKLANPKSVLDIGVGFGTYGFLAREYLDVWSISDEYGNWKTRIDGIEVFEQYITVIQKSIYNNIYIGNATNILERINYNYDLILIIDVLEHFDYHEGHKLLEICSKIGRNILISVPKNIGVQEIVYGNIYETHKYKFNKKDFGIFRDKFFLPNYESYICFAGADANNLKTEAILTDIGYSLVKYLPFLRRPLISLKKVVDSLRK
jgi:hypothetical protein